MYVLWTERCTGHQITNLKISDSQEEGRQIKHRYENLFDSPNQLHQRNRLTLENWTSFFGMVLWIYIYVYIYLYILDLCYCEKKLAIVITTLSGPAII